MHLKLQYQSQFGILGSAMHSGTGQRSSLTKVTVICCHAYRCVLLTQCPALNTSQNTFPVNLDV